MTNPHPQLRRQEVYKYLRGTLTLISSFLWYFGTEVYSNDDNLWLVRRAVYAVCVNSWSC
jgi:hypothetical protein